MKTDRELPELDSSRPDNDVGSMVSVVLICLAVLAVVLWATKTAAVIGASL